MIDLHCHSYVSDGALSPSEVVQLATQNGCQMLALTDHDNTDGLNEAHQAAERCGIRLIDGVEISVTWRSRTIHIVGLDIEKNNETLQKLLQNVRTGRVARLQKIADKLNKLGINGAFDGAMARVHNPEMVSRTHLADFLVENGWARNKQQAFKKFLGEGKAAYVAHEWANLADAIQAIIAANGLAVIAHPMRYQLSATARRNLFSEFKTLGGIGMEVHSGHSSWGDCLNYTQLANQFGLLASCGSDFHRLNDFSGGMVGKCPSLPENVQVIWTQFRS